jgi:WD40 repeat protein
LLLETGASRACWSPDGRFLAVGGTNGSVQIWNASERRLAGQFAVGSNAVVPLQFDRENKRLAVVAANTFEIWTLAPFRKSLSTEIPAGHQVIDYSSYVFFAPQLAPDLDLVPMRGPKSDGRSMSLWSPATGRIVKLTEDSETSRDPYGGITEIAFSPDGALVALCGFSGETRVHDTRTGIRRASLRGFFTGATTACFSPDGRRLAIGGDGEIKIYHTATWRELITLATGAGWLSNLQFSRTGDSVRVRGDELTEQKDVGKLQDWRVPSFEEIAAAEAKDPPATGYGGQGKMEFNQP